jgi:hypothetical protein
MQQAKQDALEAIGKLPDDADMDEIMYRLYGIRGQYTYLSMLSAGLRPGFPRASALPVSNSS